MESENMKDDTTADSIITFRLNSEKDRDIINYLNEVTNKSAEIKRIIRAYINFIG